MDRKEIKEVKRRVEDLDVEGVVGVLERGEMKEFVQFVRERNIDGHRLMDVTEGIVKLWNPKTNAKKFIQFIEELKLNPDKYLKGVDVDTSKSNNITNIQTSDVQYRTVTRKKSEYQVTGVEEIVKKIIPAKSFLYRNQQTDKPVTSYVPMDPSNKLKPKKYFRISSYEFPNFDMKSFRFSKTEQFNDRGYYSIKSHNRYYIQKKYRNTECRKKYTSLKSYEEIEKHPDEHFYEDLDYSEMNRDNENDLKETSINQKPYKVKIQELFSSFKLPFFKKNEDASDGKKEIEIENTEHSFNDKEIHIYENSDTMAGMYDSIQIPKEDGVTFSETEPKLPVEDYLEPVQLTKDYSDVMAHQKDDSILGYILSLFENKFGSRREANEPAQSEDSEDKAESTLESKPASSMADRPLPVPVENEPYYMNISRCEAENLLRGQPDGTFVLRPSSQPNHAYTLTVSCSNVVHNVGVRRRPDGRLALGFARRGERSFTSVTSLLRHHRKNRLLLVIGGNVCGSTTLTESAQYYQTPSSLPVVK